LLAACSRDEDAAPAQREAISPELGPNVVWIVLDAARGDRVSWAGYERETTPNLDKLAARGSVFLNHHTQGLWTELSVPSYMTGRYFPVACVDVMRTYPMRNAPAGERLFPEVMREHGYYAAAFSAHAWILPDSPLAQTFDEFHYITPEPGKPLHAAELATLNKHVLPWVASEKAEQPFFLYIHTLDTHFPHILDAPHDQWVDTSYESETINDGIPLKNFGMEFTPQDIELLSALHDGSLHYADAEIQRILDALNAAGLMENTLIVVSSDHGEALGEDGTNWGHWRSYDEVMRVPFLIAGPGVPAGVRVESITENVDIVPTILSALGLESAKLDVDGVDLLPIAKGETNSRAYAFTKYFNHEYDGAPGFILRSNEYKYERDYGHEREYLWTVPDRVATRTDVLAERVEEAAEMRAALEREYIPKWDAYMALPKAAIDMRITPEMWGGSESVVVDPEGGASYNDDGQWLFAVGVLWHAGWNEDVPPLTLTMRVPPGQYIVQLEVLSARDFEGHPASAFRVASPSLPAIDVAMTPVDHTALGYEFRDIGTAEIADGTFTCTIDDGDDAYWGVLRRIRFVTPYRGDDEMSDEDVEARIEALKALGYID
jgi:arylsulfatase A-like enzyme